MRELPGGTVTFLFTDIEGSTRLLHDLGDGYADVLAEHRRALREAFSSHSGVEVDTQGDAFFVAFARARDAVSAALDGQLALADRPVCVRMGLHTGEPAVTDEGYVGLDVHRAARIAAVAHGGQVVLSERTRMLLDRAPPLRDLGVHRLKDLGEPEHLYQLGEQEFPPLRSLNATNLPAQPTALVGRERELGELLELLRRDAVRLVTLVGPGGSGKTRLGLQVAAELVADYKDGVFWIPLIGVSDYELAVPTVAATVGAKESLDSFIDEKQMLLLLDNLEQIVECGPLLADLLRSCPNLTLLTTSRAPLRVSGEHEYEVPPLPEAEAIELFVERARRVKRGFTPDEHVAEICRRLDGLPLAIELASARTKLLSTRQMRDRLGRSLDLLVGGARDLPERQQTLRATLAWSYDLLDHRERQLFARLGVFAGSFDLEDAEQVCDAGLDTLAVLVDESLLRQTDAGRFFLLETIREYAAEKLGGSGYAREIGTKHARHFLAIAEAAEPELKAGSRQAEWLDRLDREQDNLRSALAHLRACRDAKLELRLAAALGRFWYLRGHLEEGRRSLEHALENDRGAPGRLRAKALTGATYVALAAGDAARGARLANERLILYRRLDDGAGVAEAVNDLAWAASIEGEWKRARELEEETVELFRAAGDDWGLAVSLNNLGAVVGVLGDHELGISLCAESAALARMLEDKHLEATALCSCGYTQIHAGNATEAAAMLADSLRLAAAIEEKAVIYRCLDGLGAVSLAIGDLERAAKLVGAAEAVADASGAFLDPSERALHEQTASALQRDLAPESLRVASSSGRAMTLDDAITYALVQVPQRAALDRSA